ncbi:MAG: CDP-glucose 4,6-dehydratase [Bacteroidales bacterium]|nr:CDP-glucose 4,6-dehydratase [Bacteroidales bacterium]
MDFWKGKRVFVTGHTGFKGTWLCSLLNWAGASVYGYSLYDEKDHRFFKEAGHLERVTSTFGDIRDFLKLKESVKSISPDVVIHLAAQPLVRDSYRDPRGTYEINVMGTVNLLDAMRSVESIKSAVIITTDKVYKNQELSKGYTEEEPLGGFDPYSSSKACTELATGSFRDSFFGKERALNIATARAGNVIGGGDWAFERLVPDCIRSTLKGETVELRYPGAVRPWQHVLDPLMGYLILAEKLYLEGEKYAEAWNFGPEESECISVEEVVNLFCNKWGEDASYIAHPDNTMHETTLLKLDSTKAKSKLGWKSSWTVESTIESIIEWVKAWDATGDVHSVMEKQIKHTVSRYKGN